MAPSIDLLGRGEVSGIAAQVRLPAHYELRARLGEGGYGVVYEAWDSKLRRSVAIKCFKHAGSRVHGPGLLQEARFGASLDHPAFVTVHAIEEHEGEQFIVMELVRGATLKETLAGAAVAPPLAIDWVAQVAEGMRHAHSQGKVHGDLKPSNLMVDAKGQVRILDFGLGVNDDMLTTTSLPQHEPQGTITYMARERLRGAPPDAQGDIYALGVILYELTCGTRPFASLNGLALVAAHMQSSSDSWQYPPTLDTRLISLIRAMTATQPADRLRSMDLVLQELATLRQGGPGAPAHGPRRGPSRRAWQVGGGALALVLAAVLAWQLAPNAAWFDGAMAPYSEAKSLDEGLAALKLFDRPGSLDSAFAHFNRVLKHDPGNAAAAAGISLASTMRYAGDGKDPSWLRKADASAQQALKLNQQLALSHIAKGWVLESQGQGDAAMQAFERALHLDPSNFFAWYGKVRALRRAHRYQEAFSTLAAALRRFPQERVFTDELGSAFFERGEFAKAEQAFRQSIALQADAVMAYANLNAALLSQNRGDEALRVLQQGLQIRPSAKLYGNLGTALFQRADYVGAAEAFGQAVAPAGGAPGDYINWANLADSLLWIPGREQEARRAYDKARALLAPRLEAAPKDVLLVSRMALYAARTGDSKAALTLIERAMALAPRNAGVQFRAGLSYELLGQRAPALASINQALRLGYPAAFVDAEPDLVALRRDPGYHPD